MTRYRAVVLALFLAGLLGAPFAFAEKNKGSGGNSGKSSPPPQQQQQHSAPQHSSNSHDSSGGQHSANHGSSNGSSNGSGHSGSGSGSSTHSSSSSGNGYGSHDHSGDHHSGTGQSSTSRSTSGQSHTNSQYGHGNNSGDVIHHGSSSSSAKTSSYHGTRDSHGHVTVDHARLNERLHTRPGTVERQHAFEHSRVERARFTHSRAPIHFVPAHRAVLRSIRIVPTTYYYRRTVFYDTYRWQAPDYVYSLYPRYGLWDATFLAFALDHIAEEQYALVFYNHRNEDDMQQWMDDTSRLAADNDDLREKLDTMKTQMASFDRAGVTTDPGYVPPDAQDVALSPEVITQLTESK